MLKGDHLFFGNAAADGAGSRLFFDAANVGDFEAV